MTKGRYIKIDHKKKLDVRNIDDRRQYLHGSVSNAPNGIERRKTVRRQGDVLVLLEVDDNNSIFQSHNAFYQMIQRTIDKQIVDIVKDLDDQEKLKELEFGDKRVLIETRLKYRDQIKNFYRNMGLKCEMVMLGLENGKMLEKLDRNAVLLSDYDETEKSSGDKSSEKALTEYTPVQIIEENEKIAIKVFARVLNIVHPSDVDWEREAAKQAVDLEHKIIFMTEKHYKNAKKISFKSLIDQVIEELIRKSYDLVQMQGERAKLEAKFRLTSDISTRVAINRLKEKIDEIENSPLIETTKMLYTYLDFFKDYLLVSNKKNKIQHNISGLEKNAIEAMTFTEINRVIHYINSTRDYLGNARPDGVKEKMGILVELEKLLSEEVYYIQYFWFENLRGRKAILADFENTKRLINITLPES